MARANFDFMKEQCDLAANIVEVVSTRCDLRPKGREYVGLCPFHDDKKPSMTVVPKKNIFQCFSCGAGGDQYEFIKLYESVKFPDALRIVCEILGVQTDGKAVQSGGERVMRETKKHEAVLMSPRQILDEWNWYRERSMDPAPWEQRLGIEPGAIEIAQMTVAPYRHNQARKVLVSPMRTADGTLCSLRFRDFETKSRWSLDQKERIDGELQVVANTASGLMTWEEFYDNDVCIDDCRDIVIEGETDLLGGISIMMRTYGSNTTEWPARIVALPGVMACHDILLEARLSRLVVTFFDLDGAGMRAAFDHRRMKRHTKPDGTHEFRTNLDEPPVPGLLRKLATTGRRARACFPPTSSDGKKYDLRDMAKNGWDWDMWRSHMLQHGTADPTGGSHGRRLRNGKRDISASPG